MVITIESTTRIIGLQVGESVVNARIWQGATDSGIPVHCFITRIAVDKHDDASQFERELQACRAPSAELDAAYGHGIPLRLVL